MIKTRLNTRAGFSMIEILTALAIVATLAGLAIPNLRMHLERARSAEAVQILESLRKAQLAYFYENAAYTSVLNTLEINIPTTQSFNVPTVATTDPIASMVRTTGAYTIRINANGTFTCVGASCGNLGF